MVAYNLSGQQERPHQDSYCSLTVSVDCVIFGSEQDQLNVLLMPCTLPGCEGRWTLPGGALQMEEELDVAAHRVLQEHAGIVLPHLEQLQAFGSVKRHPIERVISVAYVTLVHLRENNVSLPEGKGLRWFPVKACPLLAFDHTAILEAARTRLQHKLLEQPTDLRLLPRRFSFRELQDLYEAVLDYKLDRRNFRKKVLAMNLLVDLHEAEHNVSHRPAKFYGRHTE
ncbi:8-oxo-dGTP diphosphatase [Chitinophaga costaii]|uniref:8-oxo-dGTP diphosphatase n=1 Tax=Chitinophaga costaii TaxID=1335309 RepID=A0A1C4F7C7_9BACT|nr:NUDIX domain-containing protein [Chitinophaga costaii]PUZ21254.1 NUDIX domain-containing protein [Chitinophaga costaii]SCC51401.1 8-oxo-dGTP diphosphatase [Chitinophaga costaii]